MTAEPRLLTLSAPDAAALDRATGELVARLESGGQAALDAAAGVPAGDGAQPRRAVVAATAAEAVRRLRKRDPRRVFTGRPDRRRPLVFLFSGVGDHYPGLAAGIYERLPMFRRELDRCFRLLEPELGTDLREVLYPEGGAGGRPGLAALFDRHGSGQEIHRTLIAQPLVFSMQYALARALRTLGVEPSAMLGYSVGEYVAACVAGVISLEHALRLVAHRARLVDGLPGGAMLAVMSGPAPLRPFLGDSVAVAALNGPELTVLSGPVEAVERAGRRLADQGIGCRRLAASHAFHSPMMEPLAEPLRALAAGFPLRPPAVPFVSNVTGTWITAGEATDPAYWALHLRRTIRFADGLRTAWRLVDPIFVELGPGRTLTRLALAVAARRPEEATVAQTLPGPFESHTDRELLLATAGRLWTAGVEIDWRALTRT
ncbi:acyltransferase domain-containing protein [Actinoallomurus sp. CA-142502]|uniref:acyltransferase domain-containing protein n=1 Tax=Actinoallomurus sp. CA-142502 TaxID=3239885 RepID=UPI003D8D836B